MADGSMIFEVDMNPTPAQKKLSNLAEKIEDTEAKLEKKTSETTDIEVKLEAARQSAKETEAAVKSLREEVERLNDTKWIQAQGFTQEGYISNVLNRREIAATELKEQERSLRSQNKEVEQLSSAYRKVSGSCDDISRKLIRMEEEAGGLVQQVQAEAEEARRGSSAFAEMEEHSKKFVRHIQRLAKRVFIFSAVTKLLTSTRDTLSATLKTSDEATAAMARLKGALITLAAPITQIAIPAFTELMNILTAIITEIINIVAILSGTSVESMEEAGKSLYKEADAITSVGSAAKKASKQLANFDEINKLSKNASTSSTIAPDFNLDLNPAMDKLSGLFGKINDVFRTIRAGLEIVIDDLTWSLDNSALPNSKATWLTALTALLGATIGAAFGGFAGGVIWLTIGALVGLYISGFEAETWKNEMSAAEMWSVVVAGLIGGLLGGVFGGFVGGALGFTLGAVIGLFLVKFAAEDGYNAAGLFSDLMVVLCALLGAVIGSLVTPGIGTVVGMTLGIALGMRLADISDDNSGVDSTLKKAMKDILISFVAAALGIGLVALGIVSAGTGIVITLAIGLALKFFVDSVDDSTVGKGVSRSDVLKKYTATQSLSVSSPATYAAIPALASGAVIPPNREFLAVLGDQKNGTNVEAPLATIEQALQNVISRNGGAGGEVTITVKAAPGLTRYLKYELDKETTRVGTKLVQGGIA